MSALVLELRAGDLMIINGAPVRFRTRTSIELTAHVRFMYGKQIMPPDQANSPARRIYFALQSAYIGEEADRETNLKSVRYFIADFEQATTSGVARQLLTKALMAAEEDNFYEALKLARRLLKYEDVVIGTASSSPAPNGRSSFDAPIQPAPDKRTNFNAPIQRPRLTLATSRSRHSSPKSLSVG